MSSLAKYRENYSDTVQKTNSEGIYRSLQEVNIKKKHHSGEENCEGELHRKADQK